MANNCLVTKLKGVVDNGNLVKITDLVIYLNVVTTINEGKKIILRGNCGPLRVTGDAYFASSTGVNQGQVKETVSGDNEVYIISPSNDNKLIIPKPSSLSKINLQYFPCRIEPFALFKCNLSIGVISIYNGFRPDIKSLSNKNLSELECYGLTGNVEELINVPNIQRVTTGTGSLLSGDPALIVDNIVSISSKGTFSYTSRLTQKTMVCISGGANLGEQVDNYLINSAACQNFTVSSSLSYYKFIDIVGSARTSASDAAVATLKSRGCTVKVNGETL